MITLVHLGSPFLARKFSAALTELTFSSLDASRPIHTYTPFALPESRMKQSFKQEMQSVIILLCDEDNWYMKICDIKKPATFTF